MSKSTKKTMLEAINMALHDSMEDDPKTILLGEDVADGEEGGVVGVTKGLSSKFGSRVRSTPISEQAIVGAAIGASLAGYRPIAEVMLMNFTTVAMDMIVNHAAKLRFMSGGQTNVPITIRTMTGAGFGVGGQHSDYLEAWFAHTAGIKVVAPSNPTDAYGLMRASIEDDDPVIFVENMPLYFAPGEFVQNRRIPLGKAAIVRPGEDVTVIAHSRMVLEALQACHTVSTDHGISVELIDLRTIAPWDRETVLSSVAKTKRAIVVHEAVLPFGIGAEISAVITEELFSDLKIPVKRLGAAFSPVPFSKPLETAHAPSNPAIADAILSVTS